MKTEKEDYCDCFYYMDYISNGEGKCLMCDKKMKPIIRKELKKEVGK
tara:strand:- start:18 stop:158 length:141 start_codon:yes stop_codon:yes gene_type:complete